MRFSYAALLILLAVAPASANAAEHWVGRDLVPAAPTCGSPAAAAPAPAKPTLLADNTAGQLIASGGALAPDVSSSTDGKPAAEAQPQCQSSSPTPDASTTPLTMAARMSRLTVASTSMPLIAARLSSGFGLRMHPLLAQVRMHSGVDLAAPAGSPVFATDSGRIASAGWQGGYGIAAVIEHPNGLETRYGHMSRLAVVAGQQVVRGQVIGFVGSTGLSTGPHLHYEVRLRGQAINPLSLMAPLTVPSNQRKSR